MFTLKGCSFFQAYDIPCYQLQYSAAPNQPQSDLAAVGNTLGRPPETPSERHIIASFKRLLEVNRFGSFPLPQENTTKTQRKQK